MAGRSSCRGVVPFVVGVACAVISIASSGRAIAQEPAEVKVAGTLVVEDEKGAEVDDESGSAVVDVHTRTEGGWNGRPTKVFVIEGRFELTLPPGAQVGFDAFDLENGKAYWLTGDETGDEASPRLREGIAIPSDHKLAIRARYASPCTLEVVDAETGAELSDVDVLLDVYHHADRSTFMNRHALGGRQFHPTPWWSSDVRVRKDVSPVELSVKSDETFVRWTESFWVHAPGHAWGAVDVDFRRGGTQVVKIGRGGELAVTVEGERVPDSAKVAVRDRPGAAKPDPDADVGDLFTTGGDARLEWFPVVPGRPLHFDGIPPGRYRVSLEVGERYRKVLTLATTDVEVKLGGTANAKLKVEDAPVAPELVPLPVEVHVDPGWGDEKFEVMIRPEEVSPLVEQKYLRFSRNELVADAKSPGRFTVRDTRVAPGTYQLSVDEFGVNRMVVVGSDGSPIVIEVGPPADVTLHFVDARTGQRVQVKDVGWFVAQAEDREGFSSFSRRGDQTPGDSYHARIPVGRIGVRAGVEDYESFKPNYVEIGRDTRNVVVTLHHLTGIRVRFRCDGKVVKWNDAVGSKRGRSGFDMENFYEVELKRRGGDDEEDENFRGFGPSGDGRYFSVEGAGDYRATFPPLEAFEAIAPIDVSIRNQELTDVVVDLVRKKE